jgi:RNA polymerase sigma factor (sigma-70 family)
MRKHRAYDNVSDEALLGAVASGDQYAITVFVRRYQRRVFGLAYSILGDAGLAEDTAQETFIRVLRHASVFDARRGAPGSWVLTIAHNLAVDAARVRRPAPISPEDPIFIGLVSPSRPPHQLAELNESLAGLTTSLAALPLDQRRAVVLSAIYARTAAEIATIEGIPIGTAKGRIRLGLAKLRATTQEAYSE